ncbi:hypothetical protein GCM10027079_22220 [Sediminivirga luteola]|uniref:Uncharacterized protein n=1 Tax=Sediminivirga luteola TaxID=1774748 RepID=A0A8J2TWB6_9MICO|nr:hypothetical protein GCM10011333_07380 [Sediminivirga luteola]
MGQQDRLVWNRDRAAPGSHGDAGIIDGSDLAQCIGGAVLTLVPDDDSNAD